MIEMKILVKEYGNFRAVNDISLTINRGEVFGFLGVNGAGKTTTLRMLSGILEPTSGSITIAGFDIREQASEAKRITGYVPDRPHLYAKLTGYEFLKFVGELYSVPPQELEQRIAALLTSYRLSEWQDQLIESYSHGMKQRLATCAGLVHRPQILIVDEPMVGLDPHGARMLKQALRQYAAEGMTVILSTHSLNVAEEISDRMTIIHRGNLLCVGTLDEIRTFAGSKSAALEELFIQLTSATDEAYGSADPR